LALLFTTPASAVEVGEIAPDFTMTDIVTLEDFSLSDFHGQVVVLNFWAYW
jgi:peroxiredoxin